MNLMARTAMTKHLIKRQEISFADWYAELREISGDRWGEISDQAPTCFAIWVDELHFVDGRRVQPQLGRLVS
jgi:hypothetical protein